MYTEEPDNQQFELEDMRSMTANFMFRLFASASFTFAAFIFPHVFLSLVAGLMSFSIGIPLFKDFFSKQVKGLKIADKQIVLQRGTRKKRLEIPYTNIRKVEVVEHGRNRRRRNKRRGEVTTVLFESDTQHYAPGTRCIITTASGKQVEIDSRYFKEGDFERFMQAFSKSYSEATQEISVGQGGKRRLRIHSSEKEDKLDKLLRQNESYLKKDYALRKELEQMLAQLYSDTYQTLNALEIAERQEKPIFQFRRPDGSEAYVLEKDYLPNLDESAIQMGLELIKAATKNLRVVETRIKSHEELRQKLRRLRSQEESRRKFRMHTKRLRKIQELNTQKDLDQHQASADLEVETEVLEELERLTNQAHDLDDLDEATALHNHISLFDESGGKKDGDLPEDKNA